MLLIICPGLLSASVLGNIFVLGVITSDLEQGVVLLKNKSTNKILVYKEGEAISPILVDYSTSLGWKMEMLSLTSMASY
jgi:hypothetical protein